MIIFATTKPVDQYNVSLNGGPPVGLYNNYSYDPHLLALILLTTPFGYDYELDRVRAEDVSVGLTDPEPFKATLDCLIDGKPVREALEVFNPMQMFELLLSVPAKVVEAFPMIGVKGYEYDTFCVIVAARACTWAENYRGTVSVDGKLNRVVFRGGLPVTQEMKDANQMVKDSIGGGKRD